MWRARNVIGAARALLGLCAEWCALLGAHVLVHVVVVQLQMPPSGPSGPAGQVSAWVLVTSWSWSSWLVGLAAALATTSKHRADREAVPWGVSG